MTSITETLYSISVANASVGANKFTHIMAPEDAQAEYTYDEMYELLKQGAASNGFFIEGASIEAYDGATDTSSIVEAGAPIISGVYRMEYIKQIGDNEVNGYIYFEF